MPRAWEANLESVGRHTSYLYLDGIAQKVITDAQGDSVTERIEHAKKSRVSVIVTVEETQRPNKFNGLRLGVTQTAALPLVLSGVNGAAAALAALPPPRPGTGSVRAAATEQKWTDGALSSWG